MLYGIAGGIGIGVFSFLYEKANFASFYLAARHDWANDVRYLTRAVERMGARATVAEGAAASARLLATAFADAQPCIAWVDAAALPYRAMPASFSGMASHLVVLHTVVDDATGMARIGDLTDEPIEIPTAVLAAARRRVRKDKQRVMAVRVAGEPVHCSPSSCRRPATR